MRAADLFAGAGGCSTGLLQAATKRGERAALWVFATHLDVPVGVQTFALRGSESLRQPRDRRWRKPGSGRPVGLKPKPREDIPA